MKQLIDLTDTALSAMVKMSQGNPGAAVALAALYKNSPKIDPQAMEGIGPILLLDSFGIYGSHIYVLYNDICDRNITKMITVLRACQLGFFSALTLKQACATEDRSGKLMVPISDLYLQVKERLVDFDRQQPINA